MKKHYDRHLLCGILISLTAVGALMMSGCQRTIADANDNNRNEVSDITISSEPVKGANADSCFSSESTVTSGSFDEPATDTPTKSSQSEPTVADHSSELTTQDIQTQVSSNTAESTDETSVSHNGGRYEVSNESEVTIIDIDYSFENEDDFFFIVNKKLRLPDDYSIETDFVQGSYELEKTAALHCREMIAAAKEDGINLKVLSAYRTVKYQKRLFERNVKSRMEDDGMTYDEAYYDTSINIAPPGGSEHNAGLAVDIITENDWDTYLGFEDTEEFAWLVENAPDYGFILRYLKGKEDITGYIYEPWHFRYIGEKYARDVAESGLCLEEYFETYVWNELT